MITDFSINTIFLFLTVRKKTVKKQCRMSFHSVLIAKIHSLLTRCDKCEHKLVIPADFSGLWLRLLITLPDTLFPDPLFSSTRLSLSLCCCSEKIWDVKNICYNKHKNHRPAVSNGKYSKGLGLEKKKS